MYIDYERIKKNMAINLIRDYVTIKEESNVGVMLDEYTDVIHINAMFGMGGFDSYIDISEYLEEEDLYIATRLLLNSLKETNAE